MTFQPGISGNPAGRPAGIPNKATTKAKDALALAFEGIGGVPKLSEWAAANPSDFYRLWGRLVPTEVSGPDGGDLVITIRRVVVAASSDDTSADPA